MSLPGTERLDKYSVTKHAKHKTVWVRGRFKRPHWEAVEENNLPMVKAWLAEDGTHIDDTDEDGKSAIHWCAKEGHLLILKTLIKGGARLNTATDDGWTPLMLSAMLGHNECIPYLIEAGAQVNRIKDGGWSALILAAQYNHKDCVQILVEMGADLNQEAGGKTAREWALRKRK